MSSSISKTIEDLLFSRGFASNVVRCNICKYEIPASNNATSSDMVVHMFRSHSDLVEATNEFKDKDGDDTHVKKILYKTLDSFNTLCTGDGLRIRTSEFGRVLKSAGIELPTKEDLQDMINEVDAEVSGEINFPDTLRIVGKVINEEILKAAQHFEKTTTDRVASNFGEMSKKKKVDEIVCKPDIVVKYEEEGSEAGDDDVVDDVGEDDDDDDRDEEHSSPAAKKSKRDAEHDRAKESRGALGRGVSSGSVLE